MTEKQSPPDKTHQRRKDARPAEILDAALDEFEEHGFGKATIGGIARRAGVVRGTVYLYYKDKDAVFDALMRARLTDPLIEMQAGLEGYDGDSETLLRMLIAHLYDGVVETRNITILRVLATEGPRLPHLVKLHHDRVMDIGMGFLKMIIARGIARGEFSHTAAEVDPRVLIGPALMALLWQMVFASVAEIDLEEIKEGHLRIILDGIRAKPRTIPSGPASR